MHIQIITYPTVSDKMVKDIMEADVVKIKLQYRDVIERLTGTEHKEATERIWIQIEEIDEEERKIVGIIDNYSYFLTKEGHIEPFMKGEYIRIPFEAVQETKSYKYGILTVLQTQQLRNIDFQQRPLPQTMEELSLLFTQMNC